MSKHRRLVVSCNPDALAIAVDRQLTVEGARQGIVDAVNLNRVVNSYHPAERLRDRIYERIDRKFQRFVAPHLNGTNRTGKVASSPDPVPPLPASVRELRDYRPHGIAVGLAALSTAASFARCTSDRTSDYGLHMVRAWSVAHRSFQAGRALAADAYDEAYIFNGRHAISRPIAECLAVAGCNVRYYEFDVERRGFFVFDGSIHSAEAMARRVDDHVVDPLRGLRFFEENKARAAGTASARFTGAQQQGLLPPELDLGRGVVTFFTSSPDEFYAVRDTDELSPDFPNQFSVALYIARECAVLGRCFVLRLHPHLQWKHPSWRDEWDFEALEALGTTVIQPADVYDSYQLLAHSMAVVTCGSTIGIEAAYQGIPTAVVCDNFATRLGCLLATPTKNSLTRFLAQPQTLPQARELAIRYGSYVLQPGMPIEDLENRSGMLMIEGRLASRSKYVIRELRRWLQPARTS